MFVSTCPIPGVLLVLQVRLFRFVRYNSLQSRRECFLHSFPVVAAGCPTRALITRILVANESAVHFLNRVFYEDISFFLFIFVFFPYCQDMGHKRALANRYLILTPSQPRRFSYIGNYEQYKYNTDIYTKRKRNENGQKHYETGSHQQA